MKEGHKRKMVAPIIVTFIFILYYILYFAIIISAFKGIARIAFGVIPVAMAAVMIYVCFQRIDEIKGGEEDDLSKY